MTQKKSTVLERLMARRGTGGHPADRFPILTWSRQIPVVGQPSAWLRVGRLMAIGSWWPECR
ncbi:MAG: hypothetical protein V2I76_08690, partial [Roseobacter sp.]|nr:hypothetical protein [Roseobacter sp.]